jgi:hypothetical protein
MAEIQKPEGERPADSSHYAESSARENLIEHVFLGELLRGLLRKNVRDLEVLRPEVDSGGYDLALEFNGLTRHVQLKLRQINSEAPQRATASRLVSTILRI